MASLNCSLRSSPTSLQGNFGRGGNCHQSIFYHHKRRISRHFRRAGRKLVFLDIQDQRGIPQEWETAPNCRGPQNPISPRQSPRPRPRPKEVYTIPIPPSRIKRQAIITSLPTPLPERSFRNGSEFRGKNEGKQADANAPTPDTSIACNGGPFL